MKKEIVVTIQGILMIIGVLAVLFLGIEFGGNPIETIKEGFIFIGFMVAAYTYFRIVFDLDRIIK